MRRILILTTTFICSSVYGQNSKPNTPESKTGTIQIGISFSPDIADRSYPGNTFGPGQRENETSKFGYTTGVNISFYKNKTLSFETGILYSNKGYQTKNMTLIPEQQQQPDPVMPKKAKFIYNYSYLDIPIKLNIGFGEEKVRFISGVGIVTNILLTETQTSIYEYANGNTQKRTEPSTFDNKKINISPVISAGVNYTLNERTSVRLEPTFRYGLIQPYLWSAGLNFGCYYSLK